MEVKTLHEELKLFLPSDIIKVNESLSKYTYTKIGGRADVLVFPTEYKEVEQLVSFTYENNIPLTILGNASNVLVSDGGIRGIVVNLTQLNRTWVKENKIMAQSGASIINTSRLALQEELSGLEFACGIPGSVGGAVFMNAGAYGGEVAEVLESVLVLTKEGTLKTLRNEELELGYRTSVIQKEGYVVLEATFSLTKGNYQEMKEKMDELTFLRESKQPLEYPSCGSVFKRPPGHFAGKLIQDSGLQGATIGGAQVSLKHAGFIVNIGSATSNDYLTLIKHVQHTVKEKFDVELETEVRVIGENH